MLALYIPLCPGLLIITLNIFSYVTLDSSEIKPNAAVRHAQKQGRNKQRHRHKMGFYWIITSSMFSTCRVSECLPVSYVCVYVCVVSAYVCASWSVLFEKIIKHSHIYFKSKLILNYHYIYTPYKIILPGKNVFEKGRMKKSKDRMKLDLIVAPPPHREDFIVLVVCEDLLRFFTQAYSFVGGDGCLKTDTFCFYGDHNPEQVWSGKPCSPWQSVLHPHGQ